MFTAESFATLKVIQLVIDSNITKSTILSNSLSMISNIKMYTTLSRLKYEIKVKNVLQLGKGKGNTVQLCWIPSHTGIIKNDMAHG